MKDACRFVVCNAQVVSGNNRKVRALQGHDKLAETANVSAQNGQWGTEASSSTDDKQTKPLKEPEAIMESATLDSVEDETMEQTDLEDDLISLIEQKLLELQNVDSTMDQSRMLQGTIIDLGGDIVESETAPAHANGQSQMELPLSCAPSPPRNPATVEASPVKRDFGKCQTYTLAPLHTGVPCPTCTEEAPGLPFLDAAPMPQSFTDQPLRGPPFAPEPQKGVPQAQTVDVSAYTVSSRADFSIGLPCQAPEKECHVTTLPQREAFGCRTYTELPTPGIPPPIQTPAPCSTVIVDSPYNDVPNFLESMVVENSRAAASAQTDFPDPPRHDIVTWSDIREVQTSGIAGPLIDAYPLQPSKTTTAERARDAIPAPSLSGTSRVHQHSDTHQRHSGGYALRGHPREHSRSSSHHHSEHFVVEDAVIIVPDFSYERQEHILEQQDTSFDQQGFGESVPRGPPPPNENEMFLLESRGRMVNRSPHGEVHHLRTSAHQEERAFTAARHGQPSPPLTDVAPPPIEFIWAEQNGRTRTATAADKVDTEAAYFATSSKRLPMYERVVRYEVPQKEKVYILVDEH